MEKKTEAVKSLPKGCVIIFIFMLFLPGCLSLVSFGEVRDLPGFEKGELAREKLVYDPAVKGYRVATEDDEQQERKWILRNAAGKKIQSEEELVRLLKVNERKPISGVMKGTVYAFAVVYSPVVLIENAVGMVLGLPIIPLAYRVGKEHEIAAEEAYYSGRRFFEFGQIEEALIEWDYARISDSGLRFYSDIDYWHGRAFEAQGDFDNARTAYLIFLGYSQSILPAYFNKAEIPDGLWLNEAEDAERRIFSLSTTSIKTPSSDKEPVVQTN